MGADVCHGKIGILYPGEMGSSLGRLMAESGFHVMTTTEGRSSRTRSLCQKAGFEVVDSVGELVTQAQVLISLVVPGAALSLAAEVAEHTHKSSKHLTYIDANSVSPMTVARMVELFAGAPVDLVDASIFGLARQLRERGSVFLSGSCAGEVAELFRSVHRFKVVGQSPGQASALKMIISGIPKGISALFMETLCFADNMHMLHEALAVCDEIYPGVMEVVSRMLPTYSQHSARRCDELREVEATMLASGIVPRSVRAAREVTCEVSQVKWTDKSNREVSIADVILQLQERGVLKASVARKGWTTN